MLLDIYRHRCIKCRRVTKVLHEIKPRSLRPNTWEYWANRVTLCQECHEWAHKHSTKNSEEQLRELQKRRLIEYHGLAAWRRLDKILSSDRLF